MAFTAFDSKTEWSLERKYGELRISEYSWGYKSDGSYFVSREPLDTSVCTPEQLGLAEGRKGAEFLPTHSTA